MQNPMLSTIIEGALFAAGKALSIDKLQALFPETERPSTQLVYEALQKIKADYVAEERAIELKEVASGYAFFVKQSLGEWVTRLWEERPQKYTRALLETLVIIAYRQPVTRADIEHIRGVAVSSQIIKTLHEREWIRVVGHRDVPGKPSLYATTKTFLDYFGLKNLDELPPLSELKNLDELVVDIPIAPQQQELALELAPEEEREVETEAESEDEAMI